MEANEILAKAEILRNSLSTGFRDEIVKSLYTEAENIAKRAVKTATDKKYDFDQKIDRLVTSPICGSADHADPAWHHHLADSFGRKRCISLDRRRACLASAIMVARSSIKSECRGGSRASFGTASISVWHGS